MKGDKNLKKLIWDKLNLVKSEQLVDLETFLLSLKLLSIFDSEAPNLEHALDSEAPMLTFKPAQNKPPEVGKVLNAFADLIPENSAQKNPMENLEMNKWTPSQDTNSNDTSMSFSESTKQRAPPTKPYNPFSELPVSDPQNLRVCLENWHAEFEVLKPETSGFYDDISKLKQMSKKYFLQKSEPTAQTRFDLVSDYSKNKTKERNQILTQTLYRSCTCSLLTCQPPCSLRLCPNTSSTT